MRVGILLSGRFPTEKAYGVTTNGTIGSLLDLGHDVVVFGIESDYDEDSIEDREYTIENYKENAVSKLLKRISFGDVWKLNQIAWKLYWALLKLLNKEKISEYGFDLLWIRDIHMLRFSMGSQNLVIEIHQKIRKSHFSKLTRCARTKNLLVAPISIALLEEFNEHTSSLKIVYAPMGLNRNMIVSEKSVKPLLLSLQSAIKSRSGKIDVGYVGKFFPNGYSKGLEDILKFSRVKEDLSGLFHISFTGGTEKEIVRLKKVINESGLRVQDFEINPHISHPLALKKMQELDVIVLPMPTSQSYVGFPLKCIEAVASGRITVAARCRIYTDIFSTEYQPYWYEPGNPISLYNAIVEALLDPNLEARINLGLVFANQFTWESRTNCMVWKLNEEFIH